MLHHTSIQAMKAVGLLLVLCIFSVRSTPIESSFSLRLVDVETNVSPIPLLFLKKETSVVVEGLGWLITEDEVAKKIDNSFVHKTDDDSRLIYSTFVNERKVANGTIELSDIWNRNNTKRLSPSIDVGIIEVHNPGLNSIRVELYTVLNGDITESSATLDVRSHRQWIAAVPILFAFGLFLVFNIHIIHSLFFAMFIGSCIIEGSMINGFRAVLDTYLLQAATDSAHASILLFIVGISTLMSMVKRSGGTAAVMKSLSNYSSNTRYAQFMIFSVGVILFFDPCVSIMIVGKVIGSIMRGFPLSSAKLSFLIDTTAVPVASIFPKSTLLTFVGDLIQKEIDNTNEFGNEEIGVANGYSLVMSSIRYQFYPLLILGLAALQILTGREMGPILNAENKAQVSFGRFQEFNEGHISIRKRSWNWFIPIVILNIFLWYTFSQVYLDHSGGSRDPEFWATSWLTSVVATVIITQLIFVVQKKNGKILFFSGYFDRKESEKTSYLTGTFPSESYSASYSYNLSSKSEDTGKVSRDDNSCMIFEAISGEETEISVEPLLSPREGIACLVHGISTAIPMTLSLIFAWAISSVYIALGVDRVILSWILNDSLSTEILPVTVFLASFLLSLVIGSSWSSVSILIPGTILPLIDSLGGDSNALIIALASIISGAAAGDHIGPFSESTILSAIVTGSEVRQHFLTQAPYALFVFALSVLVGILPVSYNGYPYYVGYIIGVAVLIIFIILVCRQLEQYQSSILGKINDLTMKHGKGGGTSEESSQLDADSSSRMMNLESFKKSLQQIDSEGCDPILGVIEEGLMPEDFLSDQESLQNERLLSIKDDKGKKRFIEDTIKNAEEDGNIFSDSLRTFLRTAEQKLGNILVNNETIEISGSGSADSTGDDSLDNLMMDIAAKGWRTNINSLLGDETEALTSFGEECEYTTDGTDGGSTLVLTDDSATATSSTTGGNGHSTYFSGNGDATSCASSESSQSDYSGENSHLMDPVELNKTRHTIQHGWHHNEDISGDDYTRSSF